MAAIDEVKKICARLSGLGWGELLARHGLNIDASDLAAELARELPDVDRGVAGFEDFARNANKGVDPGKPSHSLLYHALASPAVHPTADGSPSDSPDAYATLDELDALENYIYAAANRSLADFPGAVIAVFAYQYRVGARTPHGLYADTAYSRTGVSRVGTAPANYDPARRSFWVGPRDGGDAIAVMPARYGAFLASPRKPGVRDAVLEKKTSDMQRTFLFPRHKLFAGVECLRGVSVGLDFAEFHRNEKVRRVHTHGGIPLLAGFRLDEAPFVRDSRNSSDLLRLQRAGDSVLVVPQDQPQMVRTATQVNSLTGREELVRFVVPPDNDPSPARNRFWTSYQIFAPRDEREAPEYVNIRHEVVSDGQGGMKTEDLNLLPIDPNPLLDPFTRKLRLGNYEAAHFIDDTCDGCVVAGVEVNGVSSNLPNRAAYSLVTAPDFFPLADQIVIARWAMSVLGNVQDHFAQGGPEPLSSGRLASNPTLIRPDLVGQRAFARDDMTLTAVVSTVEFGTGPAARPQPADKSISHLPDNASNVFFPGWDVSRGRDGNGLYNAAYGLGSPFPEDAKLCAALNSFWPAVAPDMSRSFNTPPTGKPMLDEELGYHPDHPKVLAGEARSARGWDGEFGPFFETVNGELFVNYVSRDRSDYVSNTLAGLIRVAPLAAVDAPELIRRMEALRACVRVLPPSGDAVSTTSLYLATAEAVGDWTARGDRGDSALAGPGYLFVFAQLEDRRRERLTDDARRLRLRVLNTLTCQVVTGASKAEALCWRAGGGSFKLVRNP
ncbi:MAG TPA: hypothetical protein VK421_18765 [Pyrinomonadaceae bacterium]|nr:hypothetical protein [Pyrinomonadaceae bacterium]